MILVDSSVWIDFFQNRSTPQVEWLDNRLGSEPVVVGDLILAEILQGFRSDKGFDEARRLLCGLDVIVIGGADLAIEAARNYRRLRASGATVRGTVDVLIATRCLVDGLRLLHSDRDFEVFERHLGLQTVDCAI